MHKALSFFSSYFRDRTVRFYVSMLFGLVVNEFYIILNVVSGIVYSDVWFIAVAVYYMILVAVRYLVVGVDFFSYDKEALKKIYSGSQTTGILMMIITVPMSGILIYTVFYPRELKISGFNLAVFLIYALYSISRTLYLLIFSDKKCLNSVFGVYTIRFSASVFSLFNLQTSYLSYTDLTDRVILLINLISGIIASVSVFAFAGVSVKRSRLRLKELERI